MTITYSLSVASSTFCGMHKLLLRWKGSIWKSIWPELTVWLMAYFFISCLYRYGMNEEQQQTFAQLIAFFDRYSEYIPISFILGFFVTAVFGRWSQIFDNIGWIDSPALLIATYVRGVDEGARRIRRNMIRYLVLTQAMVFRDVSTCVKKRFPTMNHLVTAGIMTEHELREFDSVKSPHIKYWLPMEWTFTLLRKARDAKLVESDIIYVDMLEKLRQYRVNVLTLTLYDWVPVPLVYTQVVNIAVRSYFMVALIGRQYRLDVDDAIDLILPIMSIMQFMFYVGWMKVAEVLLNPLGEDDDDFETNWILDRNLQVGLSIVDDAYGRLPDLERDQFWEDLVPQPLYTAESAQRPSNPMIGSCNDLIGVSEDALLLRNPRPRLMSTIPTTDPKNVKGIDVEMDIDGEPVVPVPIHNPIMRRCSSVDHYSDSNSSDNRNYRLLDSLRRRFSRRRRSRRASTDSVTFGDWYEKEPSKPPSAYRNGRVYPGGGGQFSRNSSICSSILYDGVQTPFAHSLSSNFVNSNRAPSLETPLDVNALSASLEAATRRDSDGNPIPAGPRSPAADSKLAQSWGGGEPLSVIHEDEREKGRNSSLSTESASTNGSATDIFARKESGDASELRALLTAKSLSTILEETRSMSLDRDSTPNSSADPQPAFSKSVSFAPTIPLSTNNLLRRENELGSESGSRSDSRSATFSLADSESGSDSPTNERGLSEEHK